MNKQVGYLFLYQYIQDNEKKSFFIVLYVCYFVNGMQRY